MARTPDLERRQELLDRIVDYLAEHGLAQATLRPMAATLDVSINRLVHHFGSKEDLLTAALVRAMDRQIAVQEAWLERNPELTLVEMYRKWWKWMNASPANLSLVRLNYEAAALNPSLGVRTLPSSTWPMAKMPMTAAVLSQPSKLPSAMARLTMKPTKPSRCARK